MFNNKILPFVITLLLSGSDQTFAKADEITNPDDMITDDISPKDP